MARQTTHLREALLALLLLVGCEQRSTQRSSETAREAPAATLAPSSLDTRRSLDAHPPHRVTGFLKGQLHAHTNASGDSETPPAEVHAFYESREYDFVVFTDHNTVTDTPDGQLLTLPGIELTQNLRHCEPAPGPDEACLLHVNALFTEAPFGRHRLQWPKFGKREDLYARAVEWATASQSLAMLNHPNMHYGANADTIAAVAAKGLTLLEVGNQSWDSQNEGDASHPSTEALWDEVLSRGIRLWGAVTDDAHSYNDVHTAMKYSRPYPGNLGFVMVRAEKNALAIKQALARGDFYGSTGVTFTTLELSPAKCTLEVSEASAEFEVISRGRTVHHETGKRLAYVPSRDAGYVRFRVRAEGRFALTQPVFLTDLQ